MSTEFPELPTFESIGLHEPMLQTISALGYESPSPIQLTFPPKSSPARDYHSGWTGFRGKGQCPRASSARKVVPQSATSSAGFPSTVSRAGCPYQLLIVDSP